MEEKKLGFGCMRLPLIQPEDPQSIDLVAVTQMVDDFLERGFRYFDTAYPYHGERSEAAVREALVRRYPRESFHLADKMPILRVKGPEDYPRFFEEQLQRCGVDYFDSYLLHNLGRDRYENAQKFGAFSFLEEKKREGRVGRIGFSFHDDAATLERILTDHPEVDFVQLQINYLDWDSAVAQSARCYEVACRHGKTVTVMEPVKGGTLARLPDEAMKAFRNYYLGLGMEESDVPSPASLAIRYAASLPQVTTVLSGMSNRQQLADNTSFMADLIPLTEGEKELVRTITDILNKTIRAACTGCRYCTEECPKNINIPDYFGLLNLHAVTGKTTNMYYQRFAMNYGRASDCLACGRCEKICPQHLAIRDYLKEFAALYEA